MKNLLKSAILTLVVISCVPTDAWSQIYFKNNSKEPVYVAFARYVTVTGGGFWQTRGWWTVAAGTTHLAYESIKPGDSIGYWCMTTLSTRIFEGDKRLLVHPDEKFTINDATSQTVAEMNTTYDWFKFKIIGLPPGASTGTISFKD